MNKKLIILWESRKLILPNKKISFDSPLSQALLHQTAGTTVTVEAPQSSYKVKIVKVEV